MNNLESRIAEIVAQEVAKAIPAELAGGQPAKTQRRKPQPKAAVREVRAASHTFSGERVGTGTRKLTKQNRKAFIAAHAWAKPGWSTAAIRSEVAAGAKVNKGWNVAI